TEAGRSVTVQSIVATADTAGRIALAMAFTGDATGTLRLVGTPRYFATAGMINVYAWLRSEALVTLLREKARVPVGPALDRGKALLVDGLNRTIGGVMTI